MSICLKWLAEQWAILREAGLIQDEADKA